MTEKKRMLVYGNCQAGCIGAFLRLTPGFVEQFDILKIPDVHQIKQQDIADLHTKVSQAEIFLHQKVSIDYRGTDTATDHLRTLLPQTARPISFPSLYFGVYFPNLIYLRHPKTGRIISGPGGDYHDWTILAGFCEGYSFAEVRTRLEDESLYPENSIKRAMQAWERDMRTREAALDIKIADYILENFQSRRLFYVFNHPHNSVMFEVCERAAELLQVPFSNDKLRHLDHWLSGVAFPIHPAVYRALNLNFPQETSFSIGGKRNVKTDDAIEIFFESYALKPEVRLAYENAKQVQAYANAR